MLASAIIYFNKGPYKIMPVCPSSTGLLQFSKICLDVRKRNLRAGELVVLKLHLTGIQSSVKDTGVEIGCHHI